MNAKNESMPDYTQTFASGSIITADKSGILTAQEADPVD